MILADNLSNEQYDVINSKGGRAMTDLSDVIRLASSFNLNGYKNATTDKQRDHFQNNMKIVKGKFILPNFTL